MTVVFPVCAKDSEALLRLLDWCRDLGDCKTHTALIVADTDTPWNHVSQARDTCLELFGSVHLTALDEHVEGWIPGSNALFRHAAKWVQDRLPEPWLWCEPDLVPLKAGWLNAIEGQYHRAGQPFMGCIVECDQPKLPRQHMNGCGVYPPDCWQRVCEGTAWTNAFDVAIAGQVVPVCHNTRLIQSFYGQLNLGPTFAREKNQASPINTFTLANLWPEAVTFHRCKDGTLIDLLREETFPTQNFVVVLPCCSKDVQLALRLVAWMAEMGTPKTHDLLIAHDATVHYGIAEQMARFGRQCFNSVSVFKYPNPRRGWMPHTWTFQQVAWYMQNHMHRPFLWNEPDAIPVKRNWLQVLQSEYNRCRKPFMGCIIPHRGHMNGTGIYPENTPALCPMAMATTNDAWDVVMKHEMIHLCHDASGIMQHCWGIVNNQPHPTEGNGAQFRGQHTLAWINPGAVWFHRCKDGSLIDLLRRNRKYTE